MPARIASAGPQHALPVDYSKDIEYFRLRKIVSAEGQELFEQALRIAHASIGFPGYGVEDALGEIGLFLRDDFLKMLDDLLQAQTAEIEPLTAAEDGSRDFVRLGSGEYEDDMGGRLFEGLQQALKASVDN